MEDAGKRPLKHSYKARFAIAAVAGVLFLCHIVVVFGMCLSRPQTVTIPTSGPTSAPRVVPLRGPPTTLELLGPALGAVGMFLVAVTSCYLGARLLRRARTEGPFCEKCDYSLRGLTEARCPECGTAFEPDGVGAAS